MIPQEKRKPRSYKIADKPYFKAVKRGQKNGSPLASIIEAVVVAYSKGDRSFILPPDVPLPQKSKP